MAINGQYIEWYECITNIILTSAENEANFYSIGVFGEWIFCIEKWISTHTHHAGKITNLLASFGK